MRLHSLTVQAFGPFVARTSVDFDELSANGLFLLTGATGAGKTSVLDAVAFALYGQVPGDRATAKQLRNHQAPDDLPAQVELEATLAGQRVRITRSPAWQRPKKRGQPGTTQQQATVSVRTLSEGQWRLLTTRQDEAGHLIGDWLGMTLTQFTQVAMLPQGQFQAFLRADSDDRLALLQRLFRTGRHEEVERWLRERRLSVQRAELAQRDALRDRLNRLSEVAGTPHPWDGWDARQPPPVPTDWAHRTDQDLRDLAASHLDLHRALDGEAQRAAEAATAAQTLAAQQHQASAARRHLGDLLAARESIDQVRARVQEDRQVAPLVPLLDRLDQARRDQALAERSLSTAFSDLPGSRDVGHQEVLETLAEECRALQVEIEAAAQVRTDGAALEARARALAAEIEAGAPELAGLGAELEALPAREDALRTDLAAAHAAGRQLPALSAQVAAADQVLAAARLVEKLAPAVAEATSLWQEHRDEQQSLKERWLDLRELRLGGMAAELAEALRAGHECPVCGSAEHPLPASRAGHTVTAGDEKAARKLLDDAEVRLQASEARVGELRTRLDVARDEAVGTTMATAAKHQAEVATRREALSRQADAWEGLEAQRRDLGARGQQVRVAHAEQRLHLDALTEQQTALARERADHAQQWQVHRDRLLDLLHAEASEAERAGPDAVLSLARGHARALERQLQNCQRVLEETEQARRRVGERRDALHEAAAGTGLLHAAGPSDPLAGEADGAALVAALRAQMLPAAEATRLAAQVTEHDRAVVAAETVLADPQVLASEQQPPADPRAATLARDLARQHADAAHVRAAHTQRAAGRVRALHSELLTGVEQWLPLVADHELVARMAHLVDGSSPDNVAHMRLSTFVLQQRFTSVIAAANERLRPMSDARYELQQSGTRLAGERRGGLSLVVVDAWTGRERDPATLSGGETFVVSLSLALGLADVVMSEAGGHDLETLFVDEGFGALDPDTLDDVMDTLDGLRSGGRTVGVVSHVPEMRDRIPTQLRVTKDRAGSRVHVHAG